MIKLSLVAIINSTRRSRKCFIWRTILAEKSHILKLINSKDECNLIIICINIKFTRKKIKNQQKINTFFDIF